MSTNEIKKSRIKKITIKRKRTSFEKKKKREDNLEFWIEGQNWKKMIKLTNESIIKKNQDNKDQIKKRNLNYGSKDEIENKIKIDNRTKNQN